MNYERGYMLLVRDIFYGPSIQTVSEEEDVQNQM